MDLAERFKTYRLGLVEPKDVANSTSEQSDKPEVLILSCMDSCMNLSKMFGFKDGEAMILSYAGPVIPPFDTGDNASQILNDNLGLAINDMEIHSIALLGHTKCTAASKLAANIYNPGDIPCLKKGASSILQAALGLAGELSNEEMTREIERQIIIQGLKNLFDYPPIINAIKQNRLTVEGLQFEKETDQLLKLNTNGSGFRFDAVASRNSDAQNAHHKLKAANA